MLELPKLRVVDVSDDLIESDLGMVDQNYELDDAHGSGGENGMQESLDLLPHGASCLVWHFAIGHDGGLCRRVPIWVEGKISCVLQFLLEKVDGRLDVLRILPLPSLGDCTNL